MKQSKKLVISLLAFILLLLGYGIWVTIRASNLEQQLKRLEASYQKSQARHRALVSAIMRSDALSAVPAQAKSDLLRDSLGVPPATVIEARPGISDELHTADDP